MIYGTEHDKTIFEIELHINGEHPIASMYKGT